MRKTAREFIDQAIETGLIGFDEVKEGPKNVWVVRKLTDLDDDVLQELWAMYEHTYKEIGLIVNSLSELTGKYKISLLIDVDKDPFPDAFVIYKETLFGKKAVLSGSDGTKPAKSALVKHKISSLKTKGWYVEASGRMASILSSNGINVVSEKDDVERVLNKKVKWLNDNGKYERSLRSSMTVVKQLYGLPKL